jgi:cellulose synthase/poly-beta-1,6-N-acetylglucosamine synthase-like glycosyltransferase
MIQSTSIKNNISVIIPSNHQHDDLLNIVIAICSQTVKPYEVIIVDSSFAGNECPNEIRWMCKENGIKLIYEQLVRAMPGQARNVGLNRAHGEFIAFIDVQTIPRPQWLEASLNLLLKDSVAGIFGSTIFNAETKFERLVRDAFFGVLPRKTLPGSVFRREVFLQAGQFIGWVRAGEDTEWMLRLDLLNISVICPSDVLIDYKGLIGLNLKVLLKKWHRNYTASYDLPHLFPQKLFLWFFLYPTIIFIAFNWNYLFANWRMDSPLYISHITKMAAFLPPIAYIFMRGILLPFSRGVRLVNLFPLRFFLIVLITAVADAMKAYVFSIGVLTHVRKW